MEVKDVDLFLVSFLHDTIYIGTVEVPITGTILRLLTKMRYKEEEGIGVNGQGITQPFDVEQRPQFTRLGCTEG